MNQNHRSKKIAPLILAFVISIVSFKIQARDSLEALRSDLNATNATVTALQNQISGLQSQNTAQQTQIDQLKAQLQAQASPAVVYEIGDIGPAGGIVFYVTNLGTRGLEAVPTDQGIAIWGCYDDGFLEADGKALGTGRPNTEDILAGCNQRDLDQAEIAAELASQYSLNGFTDWYLPSQDELNLMLTLKNDSVNPNDLLITGLDPNSLYWSSTEATIDNVEYDEAIAMRPGIGAEPGRTISYDRRMFNKVRAIRAF